MSNIKINDVPQRIQYSATGGQTQFTIPFPFFANSYVYVWLNGIQLLQGGAPGQYVVTGAGSPSGGLVTFNTAATLNDIVTIEGIMPIDRTSIYSATISNLTGSDLNGDFNREVVMLQQLNTTQSFMQLQYAPWTEISQDVDVTKDRYIPLLLPNQIWAMNPAGDEIIAYNVPAGGGLAPADAKYLLQQADADLPNAQAMGALASGIVVNTITTGLQLTREMAAVANQLAVTNPSGIGGNPTYGFASNAIFPGTAGLGIIEGTTAQRPVSPTNPNFRFNTDLLFLEYWDGTDWVQLSETDGVNTLSGTEFQVLVNGTFGFPTQGDITLTLPQDIATGSTPTFLGVTAGNLNLLGNTLSSTDTNGNIQIVPNGTGNILTYSGSSFNNIYPTSFQSLMPIARARYNSGNGTNTASFMGFASRAAAPGSFSPLQVNDPICRVAAYGDDGTQFTEGGLTQFIVSAAPSSGVMPCRYAIYTRNTAGTRVLGMEIGDDQVVTFTQPLPVGSGGTGIISATAYGPIVGGTSATNPFQSISAGTSGQLFQSGGASAVPAWTTATFPATTTINQLLYSSAANTVAGLATANNGILVTSASGVPSIGNTVGAGLTMPSITFNSTSGVIGTTTNNNAAAGSVGEFLSTVVLIGAAVPLTTGGAFEICNLTLTAGDWDVWAAFWTAPAAGTTTTGVTACINTATAAFPSTPATGTAMIQMPGIAVPASQSFRVGGMQCRVSLAGTTTYYLNAIVAFAVSTMGGYGGLFARRRR